MRPTDFSCPNSLGFAIARSPEISTAAIMILHSRPLRTALAEVVHSAREELLIASPYIKEGEAKWVCDELETRASSNGCRLKVLTDIRSDSVLGGSLDLEALELFGQRRNNTQVVSLPRLHAKVYVADSRRALVTSANLTPSGLDFNFEYGVSLGNSALVRQVRGDLEAYAQLGSVLSAAELVSLLGVAKSLKDEYEQVIKSTNRRIKSRFNEMLRQAQRQFLSVQVGNRTAHGLFADAMIYLLSSRPLSTEELHPRIAQLLPELCNDDADLVINGQKFGKQWKHTVRNAQVFLRRAGRIVLKNGKWTLVKANR
jgi:phosphatidylserine/phosphatidylglycerophosphate/cardiolipin synthase-like enzyme